MYVVATCGVFVVGVKCDVCTTVQTLTDIKNEFIPHCKKLFFSLNRNEVADQIKVEAVCDTDSMVTALTFMDKFTDTAHQGVREQMIAALKDCIVNVYAKVYENEIQRKVEELRNSLFG